MTTAIISAAVSAIVTVIVGTFLSWGQAIASVVRRWVVPDHLPLGEGSGWAASMTTSSTDQVRVLVCCAPHRSLRLTEIDPDRAIALIRQSFGSMFPVGPVFSMPEHGVRFETGPAADATYAWAHTSGRIDLSTTIPSSTSSGIAIDVMDIIEVVLSVLNVMRSTHYDGLYGRHWIRGPRKVDWAIAVSPTVVVGNSGSQPWDHLSFPGAVPPRAGTQQHPFCPAGGYARHALQSWKLDRPASDLVRVFLRDFLYQNGFHEIDCAVHDVVQAVNSGNTARRVALLPARDVADTVHR